jgi:hypothetical protein
MTLTDKLKLMEENSKVKSIIEWCNYEHENQGELKLVWEGGNDSGWAHFEIDDVQVDNEYTRALVDRVDNLLDYGSWAGDFNASGEAVYDPTTSTFVGVDYYNEDEIDVIDSDIVIYIPKALWFNSLIVECEVAGYDEKCTVNARFIVKNGFLTDTHSVFCTALQEILESEFDHLFDRHGEVRNCNDVWTLDRDNATDDGENLVFTIKQIEITVNDERENPIVLELDDETAAAIDKQLNANNETED